MGIHSKGFRHRWCEPTRAWNGFQTSSSATQFNAGGRQRATTPTQDRFIVVQTRRRHPFVNVTTLRNELRTAVGVNISTQTVHNSIRQSGIQSRRACIRIPLTRLHKQTRLNWTQDHVNWTDHDWDPVLFTDESRYCLDFTDRRARVWRRHGERFHDVNMSKHDPNGSGWYQQRCKNRPTHRDKGHDDRFMLQG